MWISSLHFICKISLRSHLWLHRKFPLLRIIAQCINYTDIGSYVNISHFHHCRSNTLTRLQMNKAIKLKMTPGRYILKEHAIGYSVRQHWSYLYVTFDGAATQVLTTINYGIFLDHLWDYEWEHSGW